MNTEGAAPGEFKPGVMDWSTVHRLTGALTTTPATAKDWLQYAWPEERVTQFNRDGYVSNVRVLSEKQCDRLLHDYRYFMGEESHPGMDMMYEYHSNQSNDPNNVLMHALGQWRLTQLFHDLVFLPQVVAPGLLVLDAFPAHGTHDDAASKRTKRAAIPTVFQVHIALEDQTEENGTIKYIPGSHRWTRNNGGPLPVLDFNFKDMEGIKTILTEEELSGFQPVSAMLKKGEASFHHALAVHGSYGNRSPESRRATVLNYFADGVYSNTDGELLEGTTKLAKGEKMEGQFYPLVYDPAWSK